MRADTTIPKIRSATSGHIAEARLPALRQHAAHRHPSPPRGSQRAGSSPAPHRRPPNARPRPRRSQAVRQGPRQAPRGASCGASTDPSAVWNASGDSTSRVRVPRLLLDLPRGSVLPRIDTVACRLPVPTGQAMNQCRHIGTRGSPCPQERTATTQRGIRNAYCSKYFPSGSSTLAADRRMCESSSTCRLPWIVYRVRLGEGVSLAGNGRYPDPRPCQFLAPLPDVKPPSPYEPDRSLRLEECQSQLQHREHRTQCYPRCAHTLIAKSFGPTPEIKFGPPRSGIHWEAE